jgi:hypothetical protein
MTEIEIKTQSDVNLHVSKWDDGGAWIRMGFRSGSVYTSLTREQAEQMLNCLQAILAQEVTA